MYLASLDDTNPFSWYSILIQITLQSLLPFQLDKLDDDTKAMLNMLHETCVSQTGVQESKYMLHFAVMLRLWVINDVKCKFGKYFSFTNIIMNTIHEFISRTNDYQVPHIIRFITVNLFLKQKSNIICYFLCNNRIKITKNKQQAHAVR
jgi:hypothetical protein